jgi:arginase
MTNGDTAGSGTPTLLGIRYDAASSFLRGPADAPPEIRGALWSSAGNAWTESLVDLSTPGRLADAGDVDVAEDADPLSIIEQAMEALLATGARPLSLGGDHSVTLPILRAVRRRHPRLTVLQLDAHPDLYADFDGSRYTHASPFARVMEERLCDRLVQVGVRTMNGHQHWQAGRLGVETIDMRQWAAGVRPELEGPLYVSLDVDVLDPAHAPGVSHREPGGLTSREVISLIQSLPGPIVGCDLVEFNPRRDPVGITGPLCAKLVKELAAAMLG